MVWASLEFKESSKGDSFTLNNKKYLNMRVFRSCENTMDVLRKNAETIISILEVLLYDPLYSWTITPAQAYSKQFSDEGPSCLDISSEGLL